MKKSMKYLNIILVLAVAFSYSCDDYVQDVDPLVNEIPDEILNSEENLPLLIVGLKNRMGSTGDGGDGFPRIIWRATGFSDEMIHGAFGSAPDHFSFVQDGPPDVRFYEGDWNNYQSLRFLGDDIVRRVGIIDAAGGFEDATLRDEALFWGNMVGGLARMYLADHFGARPTVGDTPGASVTTAEQLANEEQGAFFTSAELHAAARDKFAEAANHDPGDVPNFEKVAWSFIARTYIFDEMYAEARSAAEQGLEEGDEGFGILHSVAVPNQFWLQSGRTNGGDFLFSPHPRFLQYVLDNREEGTIVSQLTQADLDDGVTSYSLRGLESGPGEPGNAETVAPRSGLANQNERLPLWERRITSSEISGINDVTVWSAFKEGAMVAQDFYTDIDATFELIDWREMELILAETYIDEGDNPTALDHINNVRTFHGITAATLAEFEGYDNPMGGANSMGIGLRSILPAQSITGALGFLIEERDKTLWMKGTRLADQKRFGLWHLEGDNVYKNYMPIPRSETDVNPNIPR